MLDELYSEVSDDLRGAWATQPEPSQWYRVERMRQTWLNITRDDPPSTAIVDKAYHDFDEEIHGPSPIEPGSLAAKLAEPPIDPNDTQPSPAPLPDNWLTDDLPLEVPAEIVALKAEYDAAVANLRSIAVNDLSPEGNQRFIAANRECDQAFDLLWSAEQRWANANV